MKIIVTQDKHLFKLGKSLYADHCKVLTSNEYTDQILLGTYETQKRAYEVMNEIMNADEIYEIPEF